METIRLLLVDDHPVVREGLRRMLESDPGMEVVGEAASAEEFLPRSGPKNSPTSPEGLEASRRATT